MKHAICIFLSLFLCANLAFAQNEGIGFRKVVIDAGHGGKDSGAVSKDGKTYEKNLTLDIAKRFAALVEKQIPGVDAVLTRDSDKFLELRERAEIANRADADLFVSVHINANRSTSPSGESVHILGQSSQKDRDLFAYNMDVVRRENSVILLEEDYKTHYEGFNPADPESYIFMQLMQNAYLEQSLLFAGMVSDKLRGGPILKDRGIDQNPFYVLWKTAMPAVLIEIGFISNPTDLATLRKAEQREEIAQRLCNALKDYKTLYDSSLKIGSDKPEVPQTPSMQEPETPAAEELLYGTQIFASSKLLNKSDRRFLGYEPTVLQTKSLYRYIIGVSASQEEARRLNKEIAETYPGSFMVSVKDGQTSRLN